MFFFKLSDQNRVIDKKNISLKFNFKYFLFILTKLKLLLKRLTF